MLYCIIGYRIGKIKWFSIIIVREEFLQQLYIQSYSSTLDVRFTIYFVSVSIYSAAYNGKADFVCLFANKGCFCLSNGTFEIKT